MTDTDPANPQPADAALPQSIVLIVDDNPQNVELLQAFLESLPVKIITAADGCGGAEVRQQLEDPATFLLLVQWETVAAHMEGFRNSEGFQRWRTLTHPFYVTTPVVTHFREPFATR